MKLDLNIEISFSPFENCLSIFESVNDQVTVSKYPFDAKIFVTNEKIFV